MKRVALYYRVSTEDQTTEPQRAELLEYCKRRGWENPKEFSDKISGGSSSRMGLNFLMASVRKRSVDVVICVKLDRLGRSLAHLAQLIGELDSHGVALICPSQGIDTSDGNPAGRLQMHVLAAVAEFEKTLIQERTRAGLAAARARGAKLGRPKIKLTKAGAEVVAGWTGTVKGLAEELGCSVGKAHAILKESKA